MRAAQRGEHDRQVFAADTLVAQALLSLQSAPLAGGLAADQRHRQRAQVVRRVERELLIATRTSPGSLAWDTRTGKLLARFQGHTAGIGCIAFSPDGRRIATGGSDKTVMIWDAESGQRLFALRGHYSSIATLAFSPDSTRLASGGIDGTVRIWGVRPFDPTE